MEEEICHHDKFSGCRYKKISRKYTSMKNIKTIRTAKILKLVEKGSPKSAKDMMLKIAGLEMVVLMNTKSQTPTRIMKI